MAKTCFIFAAFLQPPGRPFHPLKRTIAPLSKFDAAPSFTALSVPVALPTKAWIETSYIFLRRPPSPRPSTFAARRSLSPPLVQPATEVSASAPPPVTVLPREEEESKTGSVCPTLEKTAAASLAERPRFAEYFFTAGLRPGSLRSLDLPDLALDFAVPVEGGAGDALESQTPLEPALLERYPREEHAGFALPDGAQLAQLCFPLGLRVLVGAGEPREENFFLTLTDHTGARFYGSALCFYERHGVEAFEAQFDCRVELGAETSSLLAEEDSPSLLKVVTPSRKGGSKKRAAGGAGSKVWVFVPRVAALVSRAPFFRELKALVARAVQFAAAGRTELVAALAGLCVWQLPRPRPASQLLLPFGGESLLKLRGGREGGGLSAGVLAQRLGGEEVAYVLSWALQERKVVVTGPRLAEVSEFVLALADALYPLQWVHTLLPLLPLGLCDLLQSPWPFLLGVPQPLLRALERLYSLADVLVVDLAKRKLYAPASRAVLSKKKIASLARRTASSHSQSQSQEAPPLPRPVAAGLVHALKALGASPSPSASAPPALYRQAFLRATASLLRGCAQHTSYLLDNSPVFNREAALLALPPLRQEEEAPFFSRFFETQHFLCFLQALHQPRAQPFLAAYQRVAAKRKPDQPDTALAPSASPSKEARELEEDKLKRSTLSASASASGQTSGSESEGARVLELGLGMFGDEASLSSSGQTIRSTAQFSGREDLGSFVVPSGVLATSVGGVGAEAGAVRLSAEAVAAVSASDELVCRLRAEHFDVLGNQDQTPVPRFLPE